MRPSHLRLPPRLRAAFYAVFGVLFLSGFGWWLLERLASAADEFPAPGKPWMTRLLQVHGAAAMLALVIFGIMYPLHIWRGWRSHRNRGWGGALVAASVALVLTGYLLYYASAEGLRAGASSVHMWLGFAFPVLTLLHIWRGRARR